MTKRLPEINILKHDKKDFAKKIKERKKKAACIRYNKNSRLAGNKLTFLGDKS